MWDAIWGKILEVRSDVLAALFFGCTMILILANGHMFYADEIPRPALGAVLGVAVLSFFLWLVKLIMVASAAVQRKLGARTSRLKELGTRALRLRRQISESASYQSADEAMQTYKAEVISIFLHLKKDGFDVPQQQKGVPVDRTLIQWVGYFDAVGRMLVEGHHSEAESLAKNIVEEIIASAKKG